METREFVRARVRAWGFSAAARYFARHHIGSPQWFLAIAGDMLPRRP